MDEDHQRERLRGGRLRLHLGHQQALLPDHAENGPVRVGACRAHHLEEGGRQRGAPPHGRPLPLARQGDVPHVSPQGPAEQVGQVVRLAK